MTKAPTKDIRGRLIYNRYISESNECGLSGATDPTQKGRRRRKKVAAMGNGTLCRTETSESEPCLGNETLVRTENVNRPNVGNGVIGVISPSLLFQT